MKRECVLNPQEETINKIKNKSLVQRRTKNA